MWHANVNLVILGGFFPQLFKKINVFHCKWKLYLGNKADPWSGKST